MKNIRSLFLLAIVLVLAVDSRAQSVSFGYSNPVIPGFHPDPSVCRVGDDFYLVTSSFEFFPGVPVFHSKDLIHWEQIGYCLTRDSQLPLQKCGASAGIYAPTIRYHNGLFYMITTNVSGGGNFIVTATDPVGEWSDPIWVETTGIDPDLFFEDDKVYVCNTGDKLGIQINEIDLKTGKRIGETRHIWRGTGGRYPEGPHLFKKDGLYYLMISEGGTEYGHKVTIARSKELKGPYMGNPANPILTHINEDTQDSPIQGTGHADMVQAADGSWWMVCLAFRPANGLFHTLGRETFLAPVVWTDSSWPVVNGSGSVSLDMKVKTLPQVVLPNNYSRVEFNDPKLGFEWNYLRNPVRANYSFTDKKGSLTLKATAVGLDDTDTPTFIGRRQEHFDFEASAEMEFNPSGKADEAGMTVLMNDKHHYKLSVKKQDGKRVLSIDNRLGNFTFSTGKCVTLKAGSVKLKVVGSRECYTFLYSQGNEPYSELGKCDAYFLSSETAGGFTGVYIGLFATGNGSSTNAKASFDWFEYKPVIK
jgi:xylan 1,4-beta-xylosidase